MQNGSGTTLSSFTYLDRGYTGHEHLTVGLVHMNGRLYDPALHRFLMPDDYVQDSYNTQNFNRYAYVLNNPLRYTDPTGELTQAQWDQAMDILNDLGGGGGYIGGDMAAPVYFSSQDEGLGYGMGYMNTTNAWGSQPGWARSPEEAINRYNGGNITPGMVEGYYTQQWAGTGRENISASYSVKGGFNVSYNFNPGVGNGTGVGNVYVSDGMMAGLMGMGNAKSDNGYDWGRIGNILTADAIALYGLEKSIYNSKYWVDAKGSIRSTQLLEQGVNGKYVRGVQGLRNSQAAAARAASNYAIAGKVVGGLGMFVTGYQFLDGQISGTEASIDLIMGAIGFTGWGAPISLMYFGGKFMYEYITGNTLFEKPAGR